MSDYFQKRQGQKSFGNIAADLPKKNRNGIAPIGEKRKIENEEYFQLREIFLREHPNCECGRDGCRRKSGEIHHKKGRGKWYLVVEKWLAVARVCHRWITDHPKEAEQLGLIEKRNISASSKFLK